MPKAVCNGITLHYQRQMAPGPDVVLVHGLATSLAFWYLGVVPLLLHDFRPIVYDLRGHGQSDMPASGYTTVDMAADLHGLLDHLEIRRAHLVGHSYGGAVALHYTVLHPERVASLTVADARIPAFQPMLRPAAPHTKAHGWELFDPARAQAGAEPEVNYRLLEDLAEAQVQGKQGQSAALARHAPFGASRMSTRTAERWLQLLRTTTARGEFEAVGPDLETIGSVRQPVLAIFGEFSHCLPSCWGLKQRVPHCRVTIVPNAGHFHPIMRPAIFAGRLRAFLSYAAA